MSLVLSLFPGIGLLDRAFEAEGFCIVRGPDLLWGGDVRTFHPPPRIFDGVIGGPPCQTFSRLAFLVRAQGHEPKFGNLIPEFERCVAEAQPTWFLMENVPDAPEPVVPDYRVHGQILNQRWVGGEQNHVRRFSFGTRDGRRLRIETLALEPALYAPPITAGGGLGRSAREAINGTVIGDAKIPRSACQWAPRTVSSSVGGCGSGEGQPKPRNIAPGSVTSSDGGASKRIWRYRLDDACELQGLPRDFCKDMPFTAAGKLQAVANGVPMEMGRAVARAVKAAVAR